MRERECYSFVMDLLGAQTVYNLIHLFGVALGAGGALMSDFFFVVMTKDKKLDRSEFKVLRAGGFFVWTGLVLLIISGLLIFLSDPTTYLNSSKFLLKMFVVLVLAINGFIFHILHMPRLKNVVGKNMSSSRNFLRESGHMYISGAISVVSWISALVLGGLRSIPYTLSQGILFYLTLVLIAVFIAEMERRKLLKIDS